MIETFIQIENYIYPFEECKGQTVKVEDVQAFTSQKQLLEKKSEMQIKIKIVNSPYLVKLLKIYQEELNLHYIYEHVPYSLQNYIKKNFPSGKQEVIAGSGKLFLKKISEGLMMLISYLINMRIEVDLCPQNLGFTYEQKLKLYMNAKCKMGHKTEVSLVAYYNSCKEKIFDFIEKQFQSISNTKEEPPNFVIKGNKLVFQQVPLNQSIYQSIDNSFKPQQESFTSSNYNSCESGVFNSNLFGSSTNFKPSTASCINEKTTNARPSFLRQTQSPKFGRSFNFSESKNSPRSSKKPKAHKNSFQFGGGGNQFKFQRPFTQAADDNSDAKSFTHSRSIRIQLEQKTDPSIKKQRKDSYKVKVTSFHEYQMDQCDPNQLFGKNPEAGGDFFEFIAKQAKNFEKKKPNKEDEDDFDFEKMSEPAPFMRKQSMPERGYAPTTVSSARNLQEKVRMAKQKAENLLNRYMKAKKMSSFGQ